MALSLGAPVFFALGVVHAEDAVTPRLQKIVLLVALTATLAIAPLATVVAYATGVLHGEEWESTTVSVSGGGTRVEIQTRAGVNSEPVSVDVEVEPPRVEAEHRRERPGILEGAPPIAVPDVVKVIVVAACAWCYVAGYHFGRSIFPVPQIEVEGVSGYFEYEPDTGLVFPLPGPTALLMRRKAAPVRAKRRAPRVKVRVAKVRVEPAREALTLSEALWPEVVG